MYTAGSTGDPKAVMLSHRALIAHAEHTYALDFVGPQTTVLGLLPFFGAFGLNAVLGGWLRSGARLVVLDGFDGFFDVVHREEVTNLPAAPALLYRIRHDDRAATHLTSVTTVVCGGAALPEALRDEFAALTRLRVDLGYGLTEAAAGVSTTVGGPILGHGHVGRPLPGVEVRIDNGEDGEPGEIAIRGANLFSGYWPDGSGGPGPDGWFATGDIGYLRDGELFLVDRALELISVNGFPVYPAEVEDAILELPGVESVAVLGRPDPRTGSQVVAFVTGPSLTARGGRRALRRPAGQVQAPDHDRRRRRAASRRHRTGAEGPAARHPGDRGRAVTPRVLVLTREGCHLCDVAIETVAAVCAETGEAYRPATSTPTRSSVGRYTDQVPVTFVDGAQHDFWRVDPTRLGRRWRDRVRRQP